MHESLLIIPTYISELKHAQLLGQCLNTLYETVEEQEVIVIDDDSPNTQFKEILDEAEKRFENIQIVRKPKNEGFSKTVNIGLRLARATQKNAILINSDIIFHDEDWFLNINETDASIVGSLLLYPNDIIQHAGVYFSSISRCFDHRYKGSSHDYQPALEQCECPVTAALQMIRYECLEDIGIYDEEFTMGHEDVDYCLRSIKAGHKSVYNPKVKATHYESMFRKDASDKVKKWEKESALLLMKKWNGVDFYGVAPSMMEKNE